MTQDYTQTNKYPGATEKGTEKDGIFNKLELLVLGSTNLRPLSKLPIYAGGCPCPCPPILREALDVTFSPIF